MTTMFCPLPFQHRQRNIRHAILCVGRDLAVPMDDRIDIQRVAQIDPKLLSGVQRQSAATLRIDQPPEGCGPPVNVCRTCRFSETPSVISIWEWEGESNGQRPTGNPAQAAHSGSR
jgi:hypothetical protein